MARTAKGWTLHDDPRTGNKIVRFSHAGERYRISTRTSDPAEAARRAGRIYADVVSDRPRDARRAENGCVDLDVLCAEWLASLNLNERTVDLYEMYVRAHWLPRFDRLDQMSASRIAEYVRLRLREVTRSSVLKELAAMRGFLRYCIERGHLDGMPKIESPRANVLGTRHSTGTRQLVELSEAEVQSILQALPVESRYGHHPRAFFTVLYETGLRRSTVFRLRAPDDYNPKRTTLRVRGETDKARFGREVPLTAGARAALDSVYPEDGGAIFPEADYRQTLRDAGRRAGLDEHRVARLSYHDFRHARTTHLLERTRNLAGVAFLVGHKNVTTTNRYAKPSQRAAEAALADAFRSPFGHGDSDDTP